MNKIFKTIILINLCFYLVWHFLPLILTFDEQAETLLSWTGYLGNVFIREQIFFYMSFICPVCLVGMLLYIKAFRFLFAFIYLMQGVLIVFGGFYVNTPYDEFLEYFLTATGSLIVFISYFTSVSENYSK